MKDTNPYGSAARLWGGAERRCGPLEREVKEKGDYTYRNAHKQYKKFSTGFVSPSLCANESLTYTM